MLPFGGFFVKHAFRPSRACAALFALAVVFGAASVAGAQTLTPTPDTLIFQVTSTTIPPLPTPTPSPTATPTATPAPIPRSSFASDVSGNGRFVVIESAGDISTERTPSRNNADGNQEIFLFDYAQRRIFQITNTTAILKDTTKSSIDATNIDVQVVNLRPMISHDGRFIVFVSNAYSDANPALSPKNFDGPSNSVALKADGNTEVFIYRIPDVPDVDLSQGNEVPLVDLSVGTMTRVTFTLTSNTPKPGAAGVPPFFALDNSTPSISDDGSFIAFVTQSRSGIPGVSNADGNKEVVIYIRSTNTFVQVTNTADVPDPAGGPLPRLVFNDGPSLSACVAPLPCRLSFISNADKGSTEADANKGNGEIYVAEFNGTGITSTRQVTKTPPDTSTGSATGISVNLLSPGRRISRDGNLVAFESTAVYNTDGTLNGALSTTSSAYIYNYSANTFSQISVRPPSDQSDVGLRWPTFTGDSTRVVWVSNLNIKPDGTVATTATDGLNQANTAQIFSAPVATLNQVSRIGTIKTGAFSSVQPFPSDTIRRLTVTLVLEQGGGNPDALPEAFYMLVPTATSETPAPSPTPATSPAPVTFATGASNRAVVSPSPAPTPPDVSGLAPGMLGIARSTITLSPATAQVDKSNAHETQRRPPLPLELSGVSVSVSGAAAGLYSVAPNQINFVVPPGLTSSTTAAPVVIFNNGALIRTSLLLNPAQPDIFTSTNGAGGRAAALNITNPCIAPPGEPFTVTTTRPQGSGTTGDCTSAQTETAPTRLLIMLTGLRVPAALNPVVTVRIGTTDLTGTAIVSFSASNTPGFDQVIVDLPATLAGAGDVPVIVSVVAGGVTFTSRPADTAPHITIQ
ncbi:MAG: hypothetical protein QOH51_783 [Acidobacteriota bacterium]|jgi:uncharacterized protein (TIGR03437 family)|nr:hypothetical protein [Acidobacteriota bacterium]